VSDEPYRLISLQADRRGSELRVGEKGGSCIATDQMDLMGKGGHPGLRLGAVGALRATER